MVINFTSTFLVNGVPRYLINNYLGCVFDSFLIRLTLKWVELSKADFSLPCR